MCRRRLVDQGFPEPTPVVRTPAVHDHKQGYVFA